MTRLIAIDAGKVGIGDQICYEPIIREISTKLWPNDDIHVLADNPCVYSHLPVTTASSADDLLQGRRPDMVIPCSPFRINQEHGSLEIHPFATFATSTFIHTTDFTSLFVLHRMLPDGLKRPRLLVTKDNQDELTDMLGDVSRLTVVHTGSSDGDDRFLPSDFLQKVVDGLVKQGHTVAMVGATSRGPTATVSVSPKTSEHILDLVDKLSLPCLFALISQARLLVTNDSCPVHIAGCFDQPILLISTLKHPDHTLHPRGPDNERRWRAKAIYKKLALDDLSMEPDQLWQYGSQRFGKIRECLPDVESVLNAAKDLILT